MKTIFDAIQTNNLTGSVKAMIFAKFMEMTKTLPEEKRAKLMSIDYAEIVEILASMAGVDKYMNTAAEAAKNAANGKTENSAKKEKGEIFYSTIFFI